MRFDEVVSVEAKLQRTRNCQLRISRLGRVRGAFTKGLLIAPLAALTFVSCSSTTPLCGALPTRPANVRRPAFFGAVLADPRGWTVSRAGSANAHIVIGGRTVITDSKTERLGYCAPYFRLRRCSAFVGLTPDGVAAWVLLAHTTEGDAGEKGRLVVEGGVSVWRVLPSSLVLSQGVELPFGQTFAAKLRTTEKMKYPLRSQLEGRQAGTALWIDSHSGEVLDAGPGGCM